MLWVEMSRDETHGGGDWGFPKCLWAPTHKQGARSGISWPFWETVHQVREGDMVLHLRGTGNKAAFVGMSIADGDGYRTNERPEEPGQWEYAKSFYRAPLREFIENSQPVKLKDIFQAQDKKLRRYFEENKSKVGGSKRKLFYVIQSDRIQCQNGAYLSEVDDQLAELMFDDVVAVAAQNSSLSKTKRIEDVVTGERLSEMRTRIGQNVFSARVRDNYNHKCCFPNCVVEESSFLVGSHVARWADEKLLRGRLSNGLCLCLMHDKAFEMGLFTLTEDLLVWVNKPKIIGNTWARNNLRPAHGQKIKPATIEVSPNSLTHHWKRIKVHPTF